MKKRIIIHATNTPSDMSVTLNDIEDLNSQDIKSDPMPYHYIINIDGRILKGKRDKKKRTHNTLFGVNVKMLFCIDML